MKCFVYICCAFLMILLVGTGCKAKKKVAEEEPAPAAADKAETPQTDKAEPAPAAADKAETIQAVADVDTAQAAADNADIKNAQANPESANNDNAEADAQPGENNNEPQATDNENPAQALPSKKCEKWGTNPLFVDGHEFVYNAEESHEKCCDIDEPGWECDDDGDCRLETSSEIKCKVSLVQAESYFCASKLTCLDSKGKEVDISNKYSEFGYDLDGYWIIDSNGLYYSYSDSILKNKQAKPGDCKKTKYVLCKPETLAYVYTAFSKEEPLISFVKYKEMHSDDSDEHFSSFLTVTHEGSTWQRDDSVSGPDDFSQSVTFDETRGITVFETGFSGGSDVKNVVTLQ